MRRRLKICPFLHDEKWEVLCNVGIIYGFLGNAKYEVIYTEFKFEAEGGENDSEDDDDDDI
jgi:hypothetical protein